MIPVVHNALSVCRALFRVPALLILIGALPLGAAAAGTGGAGRPAYDPFYVEDAKAYLKARLYTKAELDEWLRPKESAFSEYDPVTGFRMHNRILKEGLDNTYCVYHYDRHGARKMVNYADKPCRINTYGSSFTDCEQVSDGETWQERLASHIQEPVRNYGIGGQTCYHSYARMQREEKLTPAEYMIVNLTPPYERQLFGWQAIFYQKSAKHPCPPQPSVRSNRSKGEFIEIPNPCPTADMLYNLRDLDWAWETFKDDFTLKIMVARENARKGAPDRSYGPIMKLAREHGMNVEINSPEQLAAVLEELFIGEAVYAAMRSVEKIQAFAEANGKKALYILTYAANELEKVIKTGKRFDQDLLDLLERRNLPYVDVLQAQVEDYAKYDIPFEEYKNRHFIGHVSPLGNFFIAYAIKDKLVELMDPKPVPYQESPNGFN